MSFTLFLILFGLLTRRTHVTYLNYTLPVPETCKASSSTRLSCHRYQLYWYNSGEKTNTLLVEKLVSQIKNRKKLVTVDSLSSDRLNSSLTTLLFKQETLITGSISYGKVHNQFVIVVFEIPYGLQNVDEFPDFLKDLLVLK